MEKKDITNAELLTAIQENNILTKGLIEQVAKNAVGIAMLDSNVAQLPEVLSVRTSAEFHQHEERISALEDTVLNT